MRAFLVNIRKFDSETLFMCVFIISIGIVRILYICNGTYRTTSTLLFACRNEELFSSMLNLFVLLTGQALNGHHLRLNIEVWFTKNHRPATFFFSLQ